MFDPDGDFARGRPNPASFQTHSLALSCVNSPRVFGLTAGASWSVAVRHTRDRLPAIIRDIVGSPFGRTAADPAWRTPGTAGMAASIYQDRAFDLMPVLADALEEAGCDAADVLAHCRGDGPHVRGCWVVDLLLGRE